MQIIRASQWHKNNTDMMFCEVFGNEFLCLLCKKNLRWGFVWITFNSEESNDGPLEEPNRICKGEDVCSDMFPVTICLLSYEREERTCLSSMCSSCRQNFLSSHLISAMPLTADTVKHTHQDLFTQPVDELFTCFLTLLWSLSPSSSLNLYFTRLL